MNGIKATSIERFCREKGVAYCRFDYRGHGDSTGEFENCTLSDWVSDTLSILTQVVGQHEKVILVGSSMGGWISLHVALQHPTIVHGIIGIGAAPDGFMDMFESKTAAQKEEWRKNGVLYLPSEYDSSPYPYTWKLIEDARANWCLLPRHDTNKTETAKKIPIHCRIRLLHGLCDRDVPWQKSMQLAEALETDDVTVTLVKSGDHRLSKPDEIDQTLRILDELLS